jgi:hypothetical protein
MAAAVDFDDLVITVKADEGDVRTRTPNTKYQIPNTKHK